VSRTDGQTDGIAIASTALAMRRAVKTVVFGGLKFNLFRYTRIVMCYFDVCYFLINRGKCIVVLLKVHRTDG